MTLPAFQSMKLVMIDMGTAIRAEEPMARLTLPSERKLPRMAERGPAEPTLAWFFSSTALSM
ncbi:hypothetical protein D3C78_1847810 [compost metagenome]